MRPVGFWPAQRVLVTGGAGFVGKHLLAELARIGASTVIAPTSKECDLREVDQIRDLLASAKPSVVIHLAARVGGIGANRASPGTFFYDNAVMGVHLIEEARRAGVGKFVAVGTICAYPKFAPIPFREEDLWNGYPEETNAPYGLAKKMMLVQAQAYREQYGFNTIYLLPVNLYGPGDDVDEATSHVIPAMIRKYVDAQAAGVDNVILWGTGMPTREFLYVKDGVRALTLAAEHYDGSEPVNIGSAFEISIRELSEMIAELVGYRGRTTWDDSMPDGQPRRKLDVTRAERLFGFRSETDFRTGLLATIDWYRTVARPSAAGSREPLPQYHRSPR